MILDIQDIINSVSIPALINDEFIKKGTFYRLKNGDLQACVGGFSIVFPVDVDGSKWAFRCWHHTLDNDQERIKRLSAELKKSNLPYFIDFDYADRGVVVNGRIYPTTRMRWINGLDIKEYICHNRNDYHKLFELALNFFKMTQDLHRLSIAHGDLQHENIIVNSFGNIFLIDYDSMYVPALSYLNSKNTTNGKDGYQHPARANCIYANEKLDYFSEAVILTSILAIAYKPELVDKYELEDTDTLLFKKSDFYSFSQSAIYSDLSSLGDVFNVLLSVISSYLRKQDIQSIEPLELAINKASPINAISLADYLQNAEQLFKKAQEEEKERLAKAQELSAWRTACRKNSYSGYKSYLFEYPLGIHAEEARGKAAECKKAEDEARRQAAIRAEESAWEEACKLNSSYGYAAFIRNFPGSKYKEIANNRVMTCRQSEDWSSAKSSNTISALESFVKKYPDSVHAVEAKSIIAGIRTQLEESRVWKLAQDSNTLDAYKDYLKRYPNGRFVQSANAKIDELKSNNGTGAIWAIILVIIVIVLGAIVASNSNSNSNSSNGYSAPPTPPSHVQQSAPTKQPTGTTYRISDVDMKELESKTEKLIGAMEVAKRVGDTRDANAYRQAGKNLDDLKKYGSKEYNSLKTRYNAL